MEKNNKPKMQIHVNQSPGAMVAFIMMIIAGLVMIVFGVMKVAEFNQFKSNCKETTGTVVGFRYSESDDDEYYYAEYVYTVDDLDYYVESDTHSRFAPDLGDEETVYYDPDEPENARTSLKERTGTILIVCGPLVGLFGAAFLLARFKANEEIIKILLGLALVIIGFPLPIVSGAWGFLIITGIFGICGIIIIVKAITKLTGNEDGAIDQAIDSKLEAAGDTIFNLNETIQESKEFGILSNSDISPIKYIPLIIKGVVTILLSLIFVIVGCAFIFLGEFLGAIALIPGIGIIIAGVKSIRHGLKLRKEYNETKMY